MVAINIKEYTITCTGNIARIVSGRTRRGFLPEDSPTSNSYYYIENLFGKYVWILFGSHVRKSEPPSGESEKEEDRRNEVFLGEVRLKFSS